MASIVVAGDTSGSITLSAPAVAGTNTLSLPALTGTVLTNKTAGVVLQVVNSSSSTLNSSNSSTYANSNLAASITPTSATSKILATVFVTGCKKQTNNTYLGLQLDRNGTNVISFELEGGYDNTSGINEFGACGTTILDSPATTSTLTYTVKLASITNVNNVSFNNSGSTSTITLMEIAA